MASWAFVFHFFFLFFQGIPARLRSLIPRDTVRRIAGDLFQQSLLYLQVTKIEPRCLAASSFMECSSPLLATLKESAFIFLKSAVNFQIPIVSSPHLFATPSKLHWFTDCFPPFFFSHKSPFLPLTHTICNQHICIYVNFAYCCSPLNFHVFELLLIYIFVCRPQFLFPSFTRSFSVGKDE